MSPCLGPVGAIGVRAEAAQQRRLDRIERVPAVPDSLERDGGAVTDAGVGARAGVSRAFLYDNAQVPLLPGCGISRTNSPPPGDRPRPTTGESPRVVRVLRDANRKLHEGNERLRNELAVAPGRLLGFRRGIPTHVTDTVIHTNGRLSERCKRERSR